MIYTGKSILEIIRNNLFIIEDGYHTFTINNDIETVEYNTEIIIFDEDVILTESPIWGDDIDDQTMLIVIIKGSLIINKDVIITPQTRKKGFLLYVKNTLTNNGTISMTARGANAIGQNVYLWQNDDSTFEYIPKDGALGGTGILTGTDINKWGTYGQKAIGRQTGGGCCGFSASGRGGNGASGTSYSGGSGGGGGAMGTGGNAQSNGGSGGNGGGSSKYGAVGGGAGNPNGVTLGGISGNSGTGGLLIIYSNIFENYGVIESKGSIPSPAGTWLGGPSGGGSINIFYIQLNSLIENIASTGGNNGFGGDGSVTLTSLRDFYFIKYNNNIFYFSNGWNILGKLEEELTADDFGEYGMIKESPGLEKTHLIEFGNIIEILKFSDNNELKLSIKIRDQIIKPISSIDLSLASSIKQIIANDIGNIYRIFSIDDGLTWETIKDNEREIIKLTNNYNEDVKLIQQNGISSAELSNISEDIWAQIFPFDALKQIRFIMLITDDNKTYSISTWQERYGNYQLIVPITHYDMNQYIDNISLTFKKDIPTDIKITVMI